MSFAFWKRPLGAAVMAAVFSGEIQASCGTALCPVDTRSSSPVEARSIRIGYEFDFIDQDRPWIRTHAASVGEIHGHHDEVRTLSRRHRILGTVGMTDRLTLDLSLPVIQRSHRHIHAHHGAALTEGWDFTGAGDLLAQVRFAMLKPAGPGWGVSWIGGLEFPTGKSRVANESGDAAEAALTPGSASWDVLGGASVMRHYRVPMLSRSVGLMPLFLSLTYQWNGKGHDDYRIGNVLSAHAGVTYPLTPRLGLLTQLNLLVREKDGAGQTHEEVEKSGGEFLYASPGLQWRPWEAIELYSVVQLPVRQRVNEIQLTSDWNLLLGASYRFRVGG